MERRTSDDDDDGDDDDGDDDSFDLGGMTGLPQNDIYMSINVIIKQQQQHHTTLTAVAYRNVSVQRNENKPTHNNVHTVMSVE